MGSWFAFHMKIRRDSHCSPTKRAEWGRVVLREIEKIGNRKQEIKGDDREKRKGLAKDDTEIAEVRERERERERERVKEI